MKKLLTLTAVLFGLAMASCMKMPDPEKPSPVIPGMKIFNYTNFTTMAALDPVNVAIRLNLLLEAAVEAGDLTYQSLATLEVEDENQRRVKVKERLFGNATITPDDDKKVWTIDYASGYYGSNYDNNRKGKVTIYTHGKRFSESGSWIVATEGLELLDFRDFFWQSFNLKQSFNSIMVWSGDSGKSVDFTVNYSVLQNPDSQLNVDWNAEGKVIFGDYDTFAKLLKKSAEYKLEVDAYGSPYWFYKPCTFSVVEPLVFSPNCGWNRARAGKVSASFDEYIDFLNDFPDGDVDCQYIVESGECGAQSLFIEYNGKDELVPIN